MSEFKELTALLFRLREKSKNSYLAYIDQCKTDEFLGAETKIRQGTFGHHELIAHTAAVERLGRNWAFSQAAEMIAEVLREMDEIGPTQEVKPIKTDFDSRPMPEKWEVGMRVRFLKSSEWAWSAGTEATVVELSPECKHKNGREYQVFWTKPVEGNAYWWTTPNDVELIV